MPSESPTIVAIDTATDVCSVAVLRGGQLTELNETVGHRHSERVLPMVDEALAKAGVSLSEVDVFAFGAGPGSFTGLRIACGVAQGLAYGKRKRVVAVGNLRALAANAFAANTSGDLLLAAIDARMNESYCAIYRRQHLTEIRAPTLELPQSLAPLADTENVGIVAGNALTAFSAVWPSERSWISLPDAKSSAAAIATLARLDAGRGLTIAPEQAAPIYVRDHVALTIDERRSAVASRDRLEERAVSSAAGGGQH